MAAKNERLARLNSDIKNLLDSMEIATLFLDSELRVKTFGLVRLGRLGHDVPWVKA